MVGVGVVVEEGASVGGVVIIPWWGVKGWREGEHRVNMGVSCMERGVYLVIRSKLHD